MILPQRAPVGQPNPLGLSDQARNHLAKISGGTPEVFYVTSDEKGSKWLATDSMRKLARVKPMFITNTWSVRDPDSANETDRLHVADGFWIDLDTKGEGQTISNVVTALDMTARKLQAVGIDHNAVPLFATGSKGFHLYIDLRWFLTSGVQALGRLSTRMFPRICREFVLANLITDQTDGGIYSMRSGRLFRQPNVLRSNSKYKVQVSWDEALLMTPERYTEACSEARDFWDTPAPFLSVKAGIAWLGAAKSVGKTFSQKPKSFAKQQNVLGVDRCLRPAELHRIRRALDEVSGNLTYPDWIRCGMALANTGAADAFDLWKEYSRKHPSYKPDDCESRWNGFDGSVSLGTLFFLAEQHRAKGVRS